MALIIKRLLAYILAPIIREEVGQELRVHTREIARLVENVRRLEQKVTSLEEATQRNDRIVHHFDRRMKTASRKILDMERRR